MKLGENCRCCLYYVDNVIASWGASSTQWVIPFGLDDDGSESKKFMKRLPKWCSTVLYTPSATLMLLYHLYSVSQLEECCVKLDYNMPNRHNELFVAAIQLEQEFRFKRVYYHVHRYVVVCLV